MQINGGRVEREKKIVTQIFIFFIWKCFLIQCEHAVQAKPIFLTFVFFVLVLFTMLLFRVRTTKIEWKKIWKKKLRKRNETNNAFFSFIWNFTYFAHYLMLIFLLNLFNIKIYNYLFKVVRSDLPQRTFLNMKCEWWREEKKFPRIKSKWSEIKIHREKNWNEWIRKKTQMWARVKQHRKISFE